MAVITINNELLLLSNNLNFGLTKNGVDFKEIATRKGDISVSFSAPLTNGNSKLLGIPEVPISFGVNKAFKKVEAKLYDDEGGLVAQGFIQIESVNTQSRTVSLRFYAGNTNWISDLKNIRIRDIDFSEFDHLYDVDTIVDTFTNTPTAGDSYKYIFTDNGMRTDTDLGPYDNSFDIRNFKLCLYERVLIEKIFNESGYTVKGVDSPKLNRSMITGDVNVDAFLDLDNESKFEGKDNQAYVGGIWNDLRYENVTENPANVDWDGTMYTAQDGNVLQTDFTILFKNNTTAASPITLRATHNDVNGSLIQVHSQSLTASYSNENADTLYTLVSPFPDITVAAGETVHYQVSVPNLGGLSYRLKRVSASGRSEIVLKQNGVTGTTGIRSSFFPDITAAEYIKDVMQRLGLGSTFNERTNTIEFYRFDDIILDPSKAIDMSLKVDYSKSLVLDNIENVTQYAKKNWFRYTNDENDINGNATLKRALGENIGDGAINVDNDFISETSELHTSPFAGTALLWYENDLFFVPSIHSHEQDHDNGYPFKPIVPRVLIDAGILSVNEISSTYSNIVINDFLGNSTTESSVSYGYFAKPVVTGTFGDSNTLNNLMPYTWRFGGVRGDSSNFDYFSHEGIITSDYALMSSILKKSYVLECNVFLDSIDMDNFDPRIPWVITTETETAYFLVDEISDFKSSKESTKVKLIRL